MTLDQISGASGLEGRNQLRSFITSHDGWKDMRTNNGLDLGSLTMSGLKIVATHLAQDLPLLDMEREQLQNAGKDAPKVIDGAVIDAPKPQDKPLVIDAPKDDMSDDAAELAKILERIGAKGKSKAIDETAVKAIVDKAIKDALQDATNVVRVEIKRGDDLVKHDAGTQHKLFPVLVKSLAARHPKTGFPLPIWLAGPAGAGKTYGCVSAADAYGVKFYHQPSMLMPHDLLGFRDGFGKFRSTPFVEAYRNGGFILLDEVDAGGNEALLALKGALANGHIMLPLGDDGAMIDVPRNPDCYILAAANTYGMGATNDYIGRNKLDAAFLDEFIKIDWQYDESFERSFSGNIDWAVRVQKARSRAKSHAGLKVIISPRATIQGAALIAAGFSFDDAAKMTYLAGLSDAQVKILEG